MYVVEQGAVAVRSVVSLQVVPDCQKSAVNLFASGNVSKVVVMQDLGGVICYLIVIGSHMRHSQTPQHLEEMVKGCTSVMARLSKIE